MDFSSILNVVTGIAGAVQGVATTVGQVVAQTSGSSGQYTNPMPGGTTSLQPPPGYAMPTGKNLDTSDNTLLMLGGGALVLALLLMRK